MGHFFVCSKMCGGDPKSKIWKLLGLFWKLAVQLPANLQQEMVISISRPDLCIRIKYKTERTTTAAQIKVNL